ncbi:MAG TPA: A24 family peptidase [Candidatus Dormibacteraeota bacterium]|nr:A24 family peptidase [Candidatus Dormibacteraeota bacterium]
MNAGLTVLAAAVGAGVGVCSGWLAVRLEETEKLEEEEREDHEAYERECAERAETARQEGRPTPDELPWHPEAYGWTWLERWASPVLTATGFACFAAHEGFRDGLAVHLLWVAVLTHVALFDVKHRLILDRITFPSILVALALAPVTPGVGYPNALFGALAVGAFFAIQSFVLGGSVLGLGDAKLGVIVGATTGLGTDLDHLGAVYAVITAVITAGAVALVLLALRIRRLRDPIPYGPFLCVGTALILWHGPAGP